MIDWISATVPFDWDVPINGGAVVHYRADGSVEWGTDKTLHLRGSHDARIAVRTVERGKMEFSGNPAKFQQGHNLFGSDDLKGLLIDTLIDICEAVQLAPSEDNLRAWRRGEIVLSRVDVTGMYELPSFSDVGSWLQAAGKTASVKWRGRGHFQDGTLYFGKVAKGKRSSPWQMKLYHKGQEVLVHKLPKDLEGREELEKWASNKLRIEVTLRTQELKRLGLHYVSCWTVERAAKVFEAYLSKLDIGEQQMVDVEVEEQLKPSLRSAYIAWKSGADMRNVLLRATFYRYRKEIMDVTGSDIGTLVSTGNVVPLRRYLEAKPVGAPEWAGELFYRPRSHVSVVA